MKKLYEVTKLYYALAEDEQEALGFYVADGTTMEVLEVSNISDVTASWLELTPFGEDDDRTCREILKEAR